jgi:cation transport regulator ChaB
MPYKLDGSDAPANVQKMPANRRKRWIRIFNTAFSKCQADGGKDCEAQAFRIANGASKMPPSTPTPP